MKVLLAEDTESFARLIKAVLEQEGHDVVRARDGREAVECFATTLPDLVLMDVVMPEMDGFEATRRIRAIETRRWVPLLMMTGLSAPENFVAGLDAGADDYLIKPIIPAILVARIRSMQRIYQMQASLHGILDNVFEGIVTINEKGIIASFNKAAETMFGYAAADVVGRNVSMLMPAPYRDEHDAYLERYLREGAPRIIGSGRLVTGLRRDGATFPLHLGVTEIRQPGGNLFIGLVRDVSQEEEARRRIEYLALNDALTGLPNRARFLAVLEEACRAADPAAALLFLDLDGFKPINDELGHEAGDEALTVAAERLANGVAAEDFVARLGGDEFVVLLRGVVDADTLETVARRLLAQLSQPFVVAGQQHHLGASIGATLIRAAHAQPAQVLKSADDAMYAAKRAGKGRVVLAPSD